MYRPGYLMHYLCVNFTAVLPIIADFKAAVFCESSQAVEYQSI